MLTFYKVLAVVGGLMVSVVQYPISREEIKECTKWKAEASQIKNYPINRLMIEQCNQHNIRIR